MLLYCVLLGGRDEVARIVTVVQTPHHDLVGAQVVEHRHPTGLRAPHVVSHSGFVEGIGIGAERDEGVFQVMHVRIDQQHRRGRKRHKVEERAAVVVRPNVSSRVRRYRHEIICCPRSQVAELQGMREGQKAVRDRAVQRAVGPIPDDPRGRFISHPGDDHLPELVRDHDARDVRRNQIGSRTSCAGHSLGSIGILHPNPIAVRNLELPIAVIHSARGCRNRSGKDSGSVEWPEHQRKTIGLSGTLDQHVRSGNPGQIEVEQLHLDPARHGVMGPIQQHDSGLQRRDAPRNDQRKILIDGWSVDPRVLHDVPPFHPQDILAGCRNADVDALDVIQSVTSRRVRNRFPSLKLVPSIDSTVGSNHLQIQIVHQSGNRRRKAGNIRVNQRHTQRLVGISDDDAALIRLPCHQQVRLIDELMPARAQNDLS